MWILPLLTIPAPAVRGGLEECLRKGVKGGRDPDFRIQRNRGSRGNSD